MWLTLAAEAGTKAPTEESGSPWLIFPKLFERLDSLAQPDTVTLMRDLPPVFAAIAIAVGLACLLRGHRWYRIIVVIMAAAMGAVIGYRLGAEIESAEVIVAGCLGVLLAVVAWPLMKYAVALCGGLAGAMIGANVWASLCGFVNTEQNMIMSPDSYWAGALIGLVVLGMLSFIVFDLTIMMFTAFSGSLLIVLGVIALLLQVSNFQETVTTSLQSSPMIVPMLVIVPAVVGLIIQQAVSKGAESEEA
ncbi:MAG: hypothetical protein CMJ49_09020 [Planctomycetaceae bacterium]|nr:hypothetical protein [Planctomycetaceae bacterium]